MNSKMSQSHRNTRVTRKQFWRFLYFCNDYIAYENKYCYLIIWIFR